MQKATRNPKAEAVGLLEKAADAALRKRLRALRAKPGAKDEEKADDFTAEDLEALAASLEE
jgi:hypothetical protein